jgi:hypothetical protein
LAGKNAGLSWGVIITGLGAATPRSARAVIPTGRTPARKLQRVDVCRLGKEACLGLGYGMGKDRFAKQCCDKGLNFSRELTDAAVDLFRKMYPKIVAFWKSCGAVIRYLCAKRDYDFECGSGLTILLRAGAIVLPNGLKWPYELMWDSETYDGGWVRKTRYGDKRFYGSLLTENICQALARVCLSDVVLRVWDELHARFALLVHDEAIYVVPEADAEGFLAELLGYMSETPAWWPDGPPMGAEGWVTDNYVKGD